MGEPRSHCLGCRTLYALEPIWDLGLQQVVDFPAAPGETTRPKAPLHLGRCEACGLVQLLHTVPPGSLYSDAFWYRSSVNESMVRALADVVACAEGLVPLTSGDAVLDIGANDGTLLALYQEPQLRRVGIDPAPIADPHPDHLRAVSYFHAEIARRYAARYKVITAIAMFYDLEDPASFLKAVARVLAPDGVFLVQMNTLTGMFEHGAFDNICHEHLAYYTLRTFTALLEPYGLVATHVWYNDVNGGSMRVAVQHAGQATSDTKVIARALAAEQDRFVDTRERLIAFREHMADLCGRICKVVLDAPAPRYLYGASTRGATLFQTLRFPPGTFVGAAERDLRKIGRYYLGTDIPIVTEEQARAHAKTFFVLPWHFWPSIVLREAPWVAQGGTLLCPLPRPLRETAAAVAFV